MKGPSVLLLPYYFMLQVSAALLPPENLRIFSENFQHILTWEDPNNASSVYYCVQYNEQYLGFQNATNCCNITTRQCDLTKDLTNINCTYKIRVFTFTNQNTSEYANSVSLIPIEDTILGPPIVDVIQYNDSLQVSIWPPVSHLWSKEEQQNVTMLSDSVYPRMECTIIVEHRTKEHFNAYINNGSSTIIPNLLPSTNYCVSAFIVTANPNIKTPSIPSTVKCVEIEEFYFQELYVAIAAVLAFLIVAGLVFFFVGMDMSGYICRAKTVIPKVLKSLTTSESIISSVDDFTSPTLSIPLEIISPKLEVEQKLESKVRICEEGYSNRKRLLDSDTSGTMTIGELSSDVSCSMGSSGQAKSSTEDDLSAGRLRDAASTVVSEPGDSSMGSLLVNTVDDSSNLPFDTSGVFNINLNSVCIADPADVWVGFTPPEITQEVAQVSLESHEAESLLAKHNVDFCLGDGLEEGVEYCSDYEKKEDISENDDSDRHLVSGYMRR